MDMWIHMKYTWQTSENSIDVFGIPKNPYFDPSHASVASEMKTLHISKQPLPQKYTSKIFSLSFLALKENEPKYIYSRNDKFVVFCSVALHYRIQRTYHYDCIYIQVHFLSRLKMTKKKFQRCIFEAGVVLRYAMSSFLKLQKHVRGQNRGSLGCQTHLYYFQMSTTCISYVSTCPYMFGLSDTNF